MSNEALSLPGKNRERRLEKRTCNAVEQEENRKKAHAKGCSSEAKPMGNVNLILISTAPNGFLPINDEAARIWRPVPG